MEQPATPVTFAIDLLQAGLERERILERLEERFECNRHDAIAVTAKAGAVLRRVRTGRSRSNAR